MGCQGMVLVVGGGLAAAFISPPASPSYVKADGAASDGPASDGAASDGPDEPCGLACHFDIVAFFSGEPSGLGEMMPGEMRPTLVSSRVA